MHLAFRNVMYRYKVDYVINIVAIPPKKAGISTLSKIFDCFYTPVKMQVAIPPKKAGISTRVEGTFQGNTSLSS